MKTLGKILLAVMAVFFLSGCASTTSSLNDKQVANYPSNLPDGAAVKVLNLENNGVLVGIKGVEVLRVEIYGRNIERIMTKRIGEWDTFVLPKGRWFNFIFYDSNDNMYHFVYVTAEDAQMPPGWMDESITTFQPAGWGAAMTATGFKR